VSAGHVDGAAPPVRLHVVPGDVTVRVRFADGRTTAQAVTVTAGAEVVVDVVEPAPSPTESAPGSDGGATIMVGPATEARSEPGSGQRLAAWILLGGAVAVSGLNLFFYVQGTAARNDFVNGGQHDASLHDSADFDFTASKVAWGVTGALVVGAAVLFLTAPRNGAPSTSGLHLAPNGLSLSF
jgi:hypothetical protein